ncbi:DUF2461 domain-containing protein [Dinoroseobacter sp. S76]|uniref:DUF2461 domain-containing protein n=1 Tax=Dinoroseobacter sp. S76 TaxID=3415124 RepID=UPI003C7E623B
MSEPDGFTQMIDSAERFFAELAQNNTRDWFEPRKDHYVEEIRKPATFLADIMAEELSRQSGQALKPKLFRIYRDVRFSKDKTPYNAHLHMIWTEADGDPLAPAYFFGVAPGKMDLGFGVIRMEGAGLTRYRAFVDAWGDLLCDRMSEAGLSLSDWGPDPLKRVPKPYPADHPHGDLLKRKSLIFHVPPPLDWRSHPGGLVSALRGAFGTVEPLAELLRSRL